MIFFSFLSFLVVRTLVNQPPIRTWRLSRTVVEIPQKREAYIVAECCTHFLQLLVWERNKILKLGMKMGKELKKNPQQICPYLFGILFNSFPN